MSLLLTTASARRRAGQATPIQFVTSDTNSADSITHTYSGIDLGTPHPSRHVIVAIGWGSLLRPLTGATIAGVAATIDQRSAGDLGQAAIVRAAVPDGVTGDIVFTFSSAITRSVIGVYASTATVYVDSFSTITDTPNGARAAITNPPGGKVIAAAYTGATTPAWSANVTEDYRATVESVWGTSASTDTPGALEVDVEIAADYDSIVAVAYTTEPPTMSIWPEDPRILDAATRESHMGFPGICHLGGDELLAFVRGGSAHGGVTIYVRMWRSLDGGAIWNEESPIIAGEPGRDPCAMVTAQGTILVTAFSPNGGRSYVIRSTDDGATWSSPILINDTPAGDSSTFSAVSAPIFERADGTLVAATYRGHDVGGVTMRSSMATFSTDDGLTWGDPAYIQSAHLRAGNFVEPAIVQGDGALVSIWHGTTTGYERAISTDGGLSWAGEDGVSLYDPVVMSGGYVPNGGRKDIVRLSDGRLFAIFRNSPDSGRASWMLSTDDGLTWGSPELFTQGSNEGGVTPGPAGLFVYSQSVETSPGSIATVFSVETGPGEPNAISNTAWSFFTRVPIPPV